MALTLIIYALVVGGWAWAILSKWSIIAIILIFLGGIIIVFLYAVTINPNYLVISNKFNKNFLGASIFFIVFWNRKDIMPFIRIRENSHFISQTFAQLNLINLFILTFYLLFVLFVVIKISEGFKGAIVKKF